MSWCWKLAGQMKWKMRQSEEAAQTKRLVLSSNDYFRCAKLAWTAFYRDATRQIYCVLHSPRLGMFGIFVSAGIYDWCLDLQIY